MDSYEIIMTPDAADDLAELRDYIAFLCLPPKRLFLTFKPFGKK